MPDSNNSDRKTGWLSSRVCTIFAISTSGVLSIIYIILLSSINRNEADGFVTVFPFFGFLFICPICIVAYTKTLDTVNKNNKRPILDWLLITLALALLPILLVIGVISSF